MEGNPTDLLNKLISNPEAINSIKDMLGNNNEKVETNTSGQEVSDTLPFIYEFLNDRQNSEMIKKINKAYSGYSDNSSPGLKLLDALKPYLSQRRTENLEKVKKAIKISNAFSELKK